MSGPHEPDTDPPAKKRRIDASTTSLPSPAAKILFKPFKSPVRTTPSSANAYPFPLSTAANPAVVVKKPSVDSSVPTSLTSRRPLPSHATAHQNSVALQPSVHAQIQTFRSKLDTVTQATSLLSRSPGEANELHVLTQKWKRVARAAADEVYAQSRDRVNRMGGVGAWRSRERDKRQLWGRDEEEEEKAQDEDDSDEDEDEELDAEARDARESRRAMREEMKREKEDAKAEAKAEKQKLEQERDAERSKSAWEAGDGGRDDDSYTMDMMLKTLHIEADVIGWDRKEGRWIE